MSSKALILILDTIGMLDISTVDKKPEVINVRVRTSPNSMEALFFSLKTKNPDNVLNEIYKKRKIFFGQHSIFIDKQTDHELPNPEVCRVLKEEQSLQLPIVNRFDSKQSKFKEIHKENETFFTTLAILELAKNKEYDFKKLLENRSYFLDFIKQDENWKDLLMINPNLCKVSSLDFDFNSLHPDANFKILNPQQVSSNRKSVLFRIILLIWAIDSESLYDLNTKQIFQLVGKEIGYNQYEAFEEAYEDVRKSFGIRLKPGRSKKN